MRLILPFVVLLAPRQDETDLSKVIDTLLPGILAYRASPEAGPVGDGEFLRRAMLDLWGIPPSLDEAVAFANEAEPGKRARRIDALLASPEFAAFWSRRLAGMLLGNYHEAAGGLSFVRWLGDRLSEDRPWPDILRRLIEAEGPLSEVPEVAWKVAWGRENDEGAAFATALSRQAFGINLFCARCHDHPFDHWRNEDFHQLAAFTRGRVIRNTPSGILVEEGAFDPERHIYDPKAREGFLSGPSGKMRPRLFNAPLPEAGCKLSISLADAVLQDPHTDRAFVNRVWAWLMGRGLVHPVDEFDLKNKPLSKPLLTALEAEFPKRGGSLRALIKGICLSRGYERRSDGPGDVLRITFSRGVVRPLSFSQLLASLEVATGGRSASDGEESYRRSRQVWGRPGIETEVTPLRSDARTVDWLRENAGIREMIRTSPVLRQIAGGPGPMAGRIERLFQAVLSRSPAPDEAERFGAFLAGGSPADWEGALWVLVNSTEFRTRH